MDYYDEFKGKHPNIFIELMVIANRIPHERRRRLESHGISWKEIPETEFKEIPGEVLLGRKDNEQTGSNENFNAKTTINKIKITDKRIFKDKFSKSLESCEENIQNIFFTIIDEFREIRQASTDKPDYRFYKKNIFCELIMQPRRGVLQVNLRVDSHNINSKELNLEEIKDPSKPGKKWLKFYISRPDQLNETFRIIKELYQISD